MIEAISLNKSTTSTLLPDRVGGIIRPVLLAEPTTLHVVATYMTPALQRRWNPLQHKIYMEVIWLETLVLIGNVARI